MQKVYLKINLTLFLLFVWQLININVEAQNVSGAMDQAKLIPDIIYMDTIGIPFENYAYLVRNPLVYIRQKDDSYISNYALIHQGPEILALKYNDGTGSADGVLVYFFEAGKYYIINSEKGKREETSNKGKKTYSVLTVTFSVEEATKKNTKNLETAVWFIDYIKNYFNWSQEHYKMLEGTYQTKDESQKLIFTANKFQYFCKDITYEGNFLFDDETMILYGNSTNNSGKTRFLDKFQSNSGRTILYYEWENNFLNIIDDTGFFNGTLGRPNIKGHYYNMNYDKNEAREALLKNITDADKPAEEGFYFPSCALYIQNIDLPKTFTWNEAINACGEGWRLPTATELQCMCSKKIGITKFYGKQYWSSDDVSSRDAFSVTTNDCKKSKEDKNDKYCVRCVKTVPFVGETISLPVCEIEIMDVDFPYKQTWNGALVNCPEGWRLPSKSELQSMCRHKNMIPSFNGKEYWTNEEKGENFISVTTNDCKDESRNATKELSVRYVRDRK